MIIKLQSILFPYATQGVERKPIQLSKKDRINADRLVMLFLFGLTIAGAIIFS